MATYKVLQDIEAEDKLLGPLSLKQFIFAGIALGCAYVCFLLLVKGHLFFTVFFLPPMIVAGFLAWPWIQDQPTEVWLLAKIRFHIKPRKRIWNQAGINDLVQITAPPAPEKLYTNGLDETEVKSRLKALASTIDSRGWAIKNTSVNLFTQPGMAMPQSDRLIDVSTLVQPVPDAGVSDADDIMDEASNPIAKNLDRLINAKSSATKESLISRVKDSVSESADQPAQDYWFLNQNSAPVPTGQAIFDTGPTVRPQDDIQPAIPSYEPPAPMDPAYTNMHTIQPLGDAPAINLPAPASTTDDTAKASPKTPDPAILELASNDDLNVATIARQANKNKATGLEDGEVEIPLR